MVIDWQNVSETEQQDGHYRRQLEFASCYLAVHRYEPQSEGHPLHQHGEVQVGHVMQGDLEVLGPDGSTIVKLGESHVVPSGAEHGIRAAAGKAAVIFNIYIKVPVDSDV